MCLPCSLQITNILKGLEVIDKSFSYFFKKSSLFGFFLLYKYTALVVGHLKSIKTDLIFLSVCSKSRLAKKVKESQRAIEQARKKEGRERKRERKRERGC